MATQEVTHTHRVFKYGDKTFPDPGAEYTVEQVLQHLRTYFPELGHAKMEEKTLSSVEFLRLADRFAELYETAFPDHPDWVKEEIVQVVLGIYVPARRWQVQPEDRSYHIPMPPFVFVGGGVSYKIFAVKKRPSGEYDHLYHAPCPNVHTTGGIYQGNTPFPICSPRNIQTALTLFMEGSFFNADLSSGKCQSYPGDVRRLWADLDGRKRFPLSELVPAQMTLGHLL